MDIKVGDYAIVLEKLEEHDLPVGTIRQIKIVINRYKNDLDIYLEENSLQVYIKQQLKIIPQEIYETPLYKALNEEKGK